MRIALIALIGFVLFTACKQDYTPKPRGYFRIDLPEKEYKSTPDKLPYFFEYPGYSYLQQNRKAEEELYWINIVYPKFQAKIHLSYKTVNGNLPKLIEDSRGFVYKHTIKADAISELPYMNPEKRVFGILYDIEGDAASNLQFILTDSTANFLRGSLYFNVVPNKDSLAPVIDFIQADIEHLIETFEWR